MNLLVRPSGFEPAAYGFEDRASEFLNLLKLLQATEIVIFNFLHLFRFLPILADFGKFFSHRFSHSWSHLFIYLMINSSDNQRPINCNSFSLNTAPFLKSTILKASLRSIASPFLDFSPFRRSCPLLRSLTILRSGE